MFFHNNKKFTFLKRRFQKNNSQCSRFKTKKTQGSNIKKVKISSINMTYFKYQQKIL